MNKMPTHIFTFQLRAAIIFFIITVVILPSSVFAETVYVKKQKTKITEAPSPKSKIISIINTGVPLEIINKKGKFYHVKLPDGKKGWVFRFKVTTKKPVREKGGGNLFALLDGERNIKADEASTGSSIRGLSKVSEKYANNEGIKPEHIQAVKNMEDFNTSSLELESFRREGQLGEYSELE